MYRISSAGNPKTIQAIQEEIHVVLHYCSPGNILSWSTDSSLWKHYFYIKVGQTKPGDALISISMVYIYFEPLSFWTIFLCARLRKTTNEPMQWLCGHSIDIVGSDVGHCKSCANQWLACVKSTKEGGRGGYIGYSQLCKVAHTVEFRQVNDYKQQL